MNKKLMSIALTAAAIGCVTGTAAFADGNVLNIQCWNEEFKTRLTDHYPGYVRTRLIN